MVRRRIAMLLVLALTLPGCAAARGPRLQTSAVSGGTQTDRTLVADYVRKLPIGSRVRVHLSDGHRERGTLMDATAERIVIQPRTRIPEAPREIPLDRVWAVELDTGNGSVARAIGIGVAAGAGAFLGLMLLAVAAYAD